jgi:hypothetical protein
VIHNVCGQCKHKCKDSKVVVDSWLWKSKTVNCTLSVSFRAAELFKKSTTVMSWIHNNSTLWSVTSWTTKLPLIMKIRTKCWRFWPNHIRELPGVRSSIHRLDFHTHYKLKFDVKRDFFQNFLFREWKDEEPVTPPSFYVKFPNADSRSKCDKLLISTSTLRFQSPCCPLVLAAGAICEGLAWVRIR